MGVKFYRPMSYIPAVPKNVNIRCSENNYRWTSGYLTQLGSLATHSCQTCSKYEFPHIFQNDLFLPCFKPRIERKNKICLDFNYTHNILYLYDIC